MKELLDIQIVEDRTAGSAADEGFLRVRRLLVRNRYADGTQSEPYSCDIMSRRQPDAVAVIPYEIDAEGRVMVALRSGVRPCVYLRAPQPGRPEEAADLRLLLEMPAGLLEAGDHGTAGIDHRAALECTEETGVAADPEHVEELGAALFPSPGVTDEKVFFRAVPVRLDAAGTRTTDGSVMEEAGELVRLPLEEAIRWCRDGRLPDMKTEIALVRLRDRLRTAAADRRDG